MLRVVSTGAITPTLWAENFQFRRSASFGDKQGKWYFVDLMVWWRVACRQRHRLCRGTPRQPSPPMRPATPRPVAKTWTCCLGWLMCWLQMVASSRCTVTIAALPLVAQSSRECCVGFGIAIVFALCFCCAHTLFLHMPSTRCIPLLVLLHTRTACTRRHCHRMQTL